jgi:hypothetical protein
MTSRTIVVAACFVLLAAAMLAVDAGAQTAVEQCMAGCGDAARACEGVGDGRDCSTPRSSCQSECQYSGGGGGTRPAKFGAFAYSSSARAHGDSYDYPDRASAEAAALRSCQQIAAGCEVILWFYNNCGSLAATADGTYGSGYGASKYLAEGYALQGCRQQGGGDGCVVQRTICTGM